MEHICIVMKADSAGVIDLLPDMDDETRVGIGELQVFWFFELRLEMPNVIIFFTGKGYNLPKG